MDLLVPVKRLATAKSRLLLRGALAARHNEVVLAMAADTIAAAERADAIDRITVLTADPLVADVFRRSGVHVAPDEATGGLNAAIAKAAARRRGGGPLGVLLADLPALDPHDLDRAILEADGRPAFCTDRSARGTTLLVATVPERLVPRFERDSAEQHRRLGAVELTSPGPSLRCDVDIWADLLAAIDLGLGERTGRLVSAIESTVG